MINYSTSLELRGKLVLAACCVVPGRQSPHVSADNPHYGETARRTAVHNIRLTDDEGWPMRFDRLTWKEQMNVRSAIIGRFDLERSLQRRRVEA